MMRPGQREPDGLDRLVLEEFPYPLAAGYRALLDAPDWHSTVRQALRLYEFSIRALALVLISQYVIRDQGVVNDEQLNALLYSKLNRASLGTWLDIVRSTVIAYRDHRHRLFLAEMHDWYWDNSRTPPRPRRDFGRAVQAPHEALIRARNDLYHSRRNPTSDEGWRRLAEQILPTLREVLAQFEFVRHYDLVRVLERTASGTYRYRRFRGERPSEEPGTLALDAALQPGWLYLSRQRPDVLQLHPLLIFWEAPHPSASPPQPLIFDEADQRSVGYLRMLLEEAVQNPTAWQDLRALVLATVERLARPPQRASRLTWAVLHELAANISARRFGDVRETFRRELHLPRREALAAFDQFLASDRSVFLLLGRSGIGKSSFLAGLAHEYRDQHGVCFLFYNAARLHQALPIPDLLRRDVAAFLRLTRGGAEQEIADVLGEIAAIPGIEGQRVVLVFDAINESPVARELLRRLDALVSEASYPWLKVVITSRPEGWRRIRLGVSLATDRYFRLPEQTALGIELQRFTRTELPEVYEKYREHFRLRTTFPELPRALLAQLDDPLTLKLVAEAYHDAALPATLSPGELYDRYLEQLVREQRLSLADLDFLQDDLMPYLIAEGRYGNTISRRQLPRTLRERITSEDRLSDDRSVNQSFQNLVDAEILTTRVEGIDLEIAFTYERFYDYFAGRALYDLAAEQADRPAFYEELIARTGGDGGAPGEEPQPFLWGAIRHALLLEAKAPRGIDLVLRLCRSEQPRVTEMMVGVIADLGRDERAAAERLLGRLLPPAEHPGVLQRVVRRSRPAVAEESPAERSARRVAVAAAGELAHLPILLVAARHPDASVRVATVRAGYHLWARQPGAAYSFLDQLAEQVMHGLMPDLEALEVAIGLPMTIFFDHAHDPEVRRRLQGSSQRVIARLLGLSQSGGRVGQALRGTVREQLVMFAIGMLFGVLKEMPKYMAVNYEDLEAFWRLGEPEQQLYLRLVGYLDPHAAHPREQMRQDCLAAIDLTNLLVQEALLLGLAAQLAHDRDGILPMMRELFERALQRSVPNVYPLDLTEVVSTYVYHHRDDDEAYHLFVEWAGVAQEYMSRHRTIPGLARQFHAPEAAFIGPFLIYAEEREGSAATPWLASRIQAALARHDLEFFEYLTTAELPLAAIDLRHPRAALEALGLFFGADLTGLGPLVQRFLTRLYAYAPDEVEEFLEAHRAAPLLRLAVRTGESDETVGTIIGIRFWRFLVDEIFTGTSPLLRPVMEIMAAAPRCKDVRAWLDLVIRELVNHVYGGAALRPARLG